MKSALLLCLVCTCSFSEQPLKIVAPVWAALSADERRQIQDGNVVEIVSETSYGVIIDNQAVNESTAGTNGGAVLGGAIAEASYIDKSIKNGNYSAKSQLGIGILGALLGSTLDAKPVSRFHARYAVKLGNGEIFYADEIGGDAFRQPVGICMAVPSMAPIEQRLCGQTAESVRVTLTVRAPQIPMVTPVQIATNTNSAAPSQPSQVNCKFNNLAPVSTTESKCKLIGGIVSK